MMTTEHSHITIIIVIMQVLFLWPSRSGPWRRTHASMPNRSGSLICSDLRCGRSGAASGRFSAALESWPTLGYANQTDQPVWRLLELLSIQNATGKKSARCKAQSRSGLHLYKLIEHL